jgi:hypothetical protein
MRLHFSPIDLSAYGNYSDLVLDTSIFKFPVIPNPKLLEMYFDASVYYNSFGRLPYSHNYTDV